MTDTHEHNHGLTRTRLAKEAGVGVETVRYYERRGLIEQPEKPEHAHPVYSELALAQLKFVKRAQTAGFSLKEIETLLSLGTDHCNATRSLAQEKVAALKQQISGMQDSVTLLQSLIEQCEKSAQGDGCALFESLLEEGSDDSCCG